MLQSLILLLGALVAFVQLSIAAEVDKSAGSSGNPSSVVNCSTGIQTPSGATEAVKAIYDQIREYCAQLQLKDVTSQLNNAKAREIAQALGAFSTIQGPTGKITGTEKANHIGEWYAKKALFEAAASAGRQITSTLNTGKFIVVTDPKFVQNKPKLVVALNQLKRHGDIVAAAAAQGNSLVKEANVRESDVPPGARIGIVPLLTLIPPAITAVQSLASLFRETSDLSAITVQSDSSIVVAGLATCLAPNARSNLLFPQYANKLNPFVDAYDRTQSVMASARQVLQNLMKTQAALEAKKGDAAATKRVGAVAAGKTDLETVIKNFVEYEKYLYTAGQTGQSPFENLVETASLFGDVGVNYIVLHVDHLGANAGTISRALRSDKLDYMATTQISYLVINSQGALLQSGAVPIGIGSSNTVAETAKKLSETSSFQCPKN